MTAQTSTIDFPLPAERSTSTPPERRGLTRDGVRLMVGNRQTGAIEHGMFGDLPDHLREGDVLVVNTTRTVPASLKAQSESDVDLRLHVADPEGNDRWSVEVRTPKDGGTTPGPDIAIRKLRLPGGAVAHLEAKRKAAQRLQMATIEGVENTYDYLNRHGEPIQYGPGPGWPISDYQTVFALEPGSAEMPSAGRPFTSDLVVKLMSMGVVVLPIILHTGVSSYEDHERPGDERFRVPPTTARVANTMRKAGGRIIAVGTTVVRALETVADPDGVLHSGDGRTNLLVTADRGVRVVDGLLTGWHEPRSSHLGLLEAVAGRGLLRRLYREAIDRHYLWHQFGDELLILREHVD